jgi:hypothetical protein
VPRRVHAQRLNHSTARPPLRGRQELPPSQVICAESRRVAAGCWALQALQEAKLGMAVRLDETAARCAALEGRHREQQVRQEPPQAAAIANLSSSGEQRPCPGDIAGIQCMRACVACAWSGLGCSGQRGCTRAGEVRVGWCLGGAWLMRGVAGRGPSPTACPLATRRRRGGRSRRWLRSRPARRRSCGEACSRRATTGSGGRRTRGCSRRSRGCSRRCAFTRRLSVPEQRLFELGQHKAVNGHGWEGISI